MKKPSKSAAPDTKKTPNPFEVHINRQKMTVLGQKSKNDRGLPGVSRAKAIRKRKGTLLQEYKLQNKANKFTDKRIGERSRDMTQEDKLMARFAAIRKKAHNRKSIFNLADDEVLTHKGQTLAEIEKFDDPRSDDDSSDEDKSGKLDASFVGDAHFGGGILKKTGKEGAKTHRELIDELIAESKKRKAEKQKTKEATLELTEKLDTEWKDLLPLVNKGKKKEEVETAQVDDYDKVMRELRFEARGTVSDRLKTQEEMAQDEKERLEELEQERRERMKGFDEGDRVPVHRSADDLDDDFVYEEDPDYMLSYNKEGQSNVEVEAQMDGRKISKKQGEESGDEDGEGEESRDENEEGEESEDGDEDDLSDLKASDESDVEEEIATQDDEEKTEDVKEEIATQDDDEKTEETIKTDLLRRKEMMDKAREELPYTFALPESYEALQEVLEGRSSTHQSVIIERMIKCNHPSLAENNKEKLGMLFVYLLQHLNDCATEASIDQCFEVFGALAPQLFELTQLDKFNAYSSMKEVIKEKYEDFKKIKKRNYPGVENLIFFKLVSLLFSTSDFRHQVVTPCFVFFEQILHKCRVESRKDIAYGLFIVTLVLEYTALSKRHLPAAISYLGGLLHMAIPKLGVRLIKVNPPFRPTSSLLVLVNDCSGDDFDFKMERSDLVEEEITDSFKIRAIHTTLRLIEEFDNNLSTLSSNVEIFNDIRVYLELLPTRNYPKTVQTQFEKVSRQLTDRKIERKLEYIVMEAKKPTALRLYEPKIEEV
jgi:nucleolar protein 14